MVNNKINKFTNLFRLLDKTMPMIDISGEKVANVISTFGRDDIRCKIIDSGSKFLISNKLVSKLGYTKKTAASHKSKLQICFTQLL